jgi:hypothetical protein
MSIYSKFIYICRKLNTIIMKNKYLSIKSLMLIALMTLFSTQSLFAQLPNGSVAPDFELTDLNGTIHKLYEDYTDLGYTVFIDFSAVWCGPCWSYHTSHALKDVYENHGPTGYPGVNSSTTNDVMVFFIEGDEGSVAELNGGGSSQGDWVAGTPYPIICTDPASGFGNSGSISNDWAISGWPTVYQVCPDRTLTVIGQAQGLYSLVTSCLPAPSLNDDARSFMNSSASSGCSSINPVITLQNYGLNNLTEVKIDVSLNGVFQYSTIFNQVWSNVTNSYQPLNLTTLDMVDVVLDPVTGLVNNDVISIDVDMPNGVVDTDPLNNQVISFAVDLGFDNAYWDGNLSIDVAGGSDNSWYLKQVSTNLIIASGFGGVTGATNSQPLTFNECYTLQSINGANLAYTVTDAMANVILDGSASSVEDFDNFTTGNQVWTSIENYELSSFNVFPVPAKDFLIIEGEYDYLRIIDVLGKEVLYSSYDKLIDTSKLKNGLYILEITFSNKKFNKKIQISK